jgi:hypothetical protein
MIDDSDISGYMPTWELIAVKNCSDLNWLFWTGGILERNDIWQEKKGSDEVHFFRE